LLVIAVGAAAVSGAVANSFGLWSGVVAIAAVSIVIGVIAYLMVSYPEPTLVVIDRLAKYLPHRLGAFVDRFAESVLKGFALLRSPGLLTLAGLLTVGVWRGIVAGLLADVRALSTQ